MANGAVCAAASCDHGQPPAWSPARTCLDQVCLKTQAIPCQDDSVCSLDLCDDTKGCLHPPANGPCDDGSVCSQDDKCVDGVCKGGTKVCECAQDSDCADLDDDNACNGRYICNEIDNKCLVDPASIVACSNHKDTECLANQCDPKIGACDMKSLKDGTSCDDGRACTQSDVCIDGYCIGKGDCGG